MFRIYQQNSRLILYYTGAVLIVFTGLYLSSRFNYLLFHSLAEIFSISIAWAVFMISWNARKQIQNSFLVYLGISFLFIGILDLFHTLSYKGMNIFNDYDFYGVQLWIGTRYLHSITFLFIFSCIGWGKKIPNGLFISVYAVVSGLILAFVFYWQIFPICFIEGQGLTPFKKISEYIISVILGLSLLALYLNKEKLDHYIYNLLAWSIVLTILSELAFTFYISHYGISNLVGHYLKIGAFYLIYKAVIETGLARPYLLLFRDLEQSRMNLEDRNRQLQREVEERTKAEENAISSQHMLSLVLDAIPVGVFWKDTDLNYLGCNINFSQDTGLKSPGEVVGKNDHQLSWSDRANLYQTDDRHVLLSGVAKLNYEELQTKADNSVVWLKTSKIPLRNPDGSIFGVLGC